MTAEKRARLRDLGFPIGRLRVGKHNAITDVPGVKVGHKTLIRGEGDLIPGEGPVRTGVTAIIQHDQPLWHTRVKGYIEILNGSGEMTGRTMVEEMGEMDSPILLTGTFNVPRVADALLSYMIEQVPGLGVSAGYAHPLVAECSDMMLNDMQGRHVSQADVFEALDNASDGAVIEGAVGGGTGMTCYQWKSGIGTSSRLVDICGCTYTIGVLVQSNHGSRRQMRVDGVPIGMLMPDLLPSWSEPQEGSIVIVLATDAPLTSRQIGRVTKRASLGLARTGATARNGSGDLLIGFSTGNLLRYDEAIHRIDTLNNSVMNPLFDAACEATEEAIINSITCAHTMRGRDGNIAYAIPLDRLTDALLQHGRKRVL